MLTCIGIVSASDVDDDVIKLVDFTGSDGATERQRRWPRRRQLSLKENYICIIA